MTTSNLDKKFQEKTIEYFTDSSGYFNEESCDPANWDYEPSTYGVEGVEICTSPHMVSFDDFNGGIENPGRDKIDYNAVEALQSCIKAKGIVTKGSRMLYYDIETGKKINGIKRSIVAARLGFKGWMGVGVKFDNPTALADFAYESNNPKEGDATLVHQLPNKEDTLAYVIERFEKTNRDDITEDEIAELVRKRTHLNNHISDANQGDIIKKVLIKLQSKGKSSERYIVYDDNEMMRELDSLVKYGNEWALEFWEDYDESEPDKAVIIFINMNGNGISGSYQYILRKLALAKAKKKPACFVIVAKPPRAKNATISSKRMKIITGDIKRLEETLCGCFGFDVSEFRGNLAHNKQKSQHVFLRQDSENEPEGTLIYAKDIL